MSVFCRVSPVMYISAVEQRLILTVSCDDLPESFCFEHRAAHHLIRLDSFSVVRERNDALCHPFHVRQLFPLFSFRDRSVWVDPDHRRLFYDPLLNFKVFRTVRNGIKIRHSADVGISPAGCG